MDTHHFLVSYPAVTNAQNREVGQLFNASASAVVVVRGIWIVPSLTAITGVQVQFGVNVISTVGTTGSQVVTPRNLDRVGGVTVVNGITARYGSTAGGTLAYELFPVFVFNDETNPGAVMLPFVNLLPVVNDQVAPLILRPGDGVQIKQTNAATVGLTGARILFSQE